MSDVLIRRVVVRGRVQGVGYRDWTQRAASSLALEGWVRNRRDGSVEALFAGPATAVEAMIERCRRGPSMARVAHLDIQDGETSDLALRGDVGGFVVLPTA